MGGRTKWWDLYKLHANASVSDPLLACMGVTLDVAITEMVRA